LSQILAPAAWLYSRAATARRAWYARHSDARRQLARPVISIGNLAVGGSAKTPTAAYVARLLVEMGERPAILSRGYARARLADGVVVVSDGHRIRADLDQAGDEPLMLARSLVGRGVGVFVSSSRYLAGRLAERRFGATVHVLDDGFQHFPLERSVDVLLVAAEDLRNSWTLPVGRLREPLSAGRGADVIVVVADEGAEWEELIRAADLDGRPAFRLVRRLGPARTVEGGRSVAPGDGRALMVAGVARPERFRLDLERAGWTLAGELVFGDHHRFTRQDVERIASTASAAGADLVLTTEKDVARLRRFRPMPAPIAWVPLDVSIEPADGFRRWLGDRVADAQQHREVRRVQ
jgi:tetraacyldisaccharide 4'-kinase